MENKRIKLTIEVELDSLIYEGSDDEKLWLENEILIGNGDLTLHSNDIGDSVGIVKKVSNLRWM